MNKHDGDGEPPHEEFDEGEYLKWRRSSYSQSPAAKAAQRKYNQSDKGKARRRKYARENKERNRQNSKRWRQGPGEELRKSKRAEALAEARRRSISYLDQTVIAHPRESLWKQTVISLEKDLMDSWITSKARIQGRLVKFLPRNEWDVIPEYILDRFEQALSGFNRRR